MKKIIFLALMILVSSIQAKAGEALSFSTVKEAVEFISECIETENSTDLFKACIKYTDLPDDSLKKHILERLKDLNQKNPLVELYSNKKFPIFKTKFKLGGHGFEWDHIHIDFIKKNAKWYLYDIWQCK